MIQKSMSLKYEPFSQMQVTLGAERSLPVAREAGGDTPFAEWRAGVLGALEKFEDGETELRKVLPHPDP